MNHFVIILKILLSILVGIDTAHGQRVAPDPLDPTMPNEWPAGWSRNIGWLMGKWYSAYDGKATWPTMPRTTYGETLELTPAPYSAESGMEVLQLRTSAWSHTTKDLLLGMYSYMTVDENGTTSLLTTMNNGFSTLEQGQSRYGFVQLQLTEIGRMNIARQIPVENMKREFIRISEDYMEQIVQMRTAEQPVDGFLQHSRVLYKRVRDPPPTIAPPTTHSPPTTIPQTTTTVPTSTENSNLADSPKLEPTEDVDGTILSTSTSSFPSISIITGTPIQNTRAPSIFGKWGDYEGSYDLPNNEQSSDQKDTFTNIGSFSQFTHIPISDDGKNNFGNVEPQPSFTVNPANGGVANHYLDTTEQSTVDTTATEDASTVVQVTTSTLDRPTQQFEEQPSNHEPELFSSRNNPLLHASTEPLSISRTSGESTVEETSTVAPIGQYYETTPQTKDDGDQVFDVNISPSPSTADITSELSSQTNAKLITTISQEYSSIVSTKKSIRPKIITSRPITIRPLKSRSTIVTSTPDIPESTDSSSVATDSEIVTLILASPQRTSSTNSPTTSTTATSTVTSTVKSSPKPKPKKPKSRPKPKKPDSSTTSSPFTIQATTSVHRSAVSTSPGSDDRKPETKAPPQTNQSRISSKVILTFEDWDKIFEQGSPLKVAI